ncbi:solute carrier family 35 member G1-like [Limulus polyphemus]|uniref:Solute carrier family 35 member G1-like n=1 Tax=Limulus polyphemus TaxID=6850 RepID=A0ABM1C3X8_LIMPO|nr:solute carrier family 35 member G1-like [Limulus polyphemus]
MENNSFRPKNTGTHDIFTEVSMNEDLSDTVSSYPHTFNKNTEVIRKISFLGLLCSLISALFFASASFIVAFVTNVDPMEILVIRSCIQLLMYVPVVIYKKTSFFGVKGERWFLCMRAVVGTVAMGMGYYSFRLIPLADASTIIFSCPALVTLFACVLLREPCGVFQVFTVILTLTGVVLISRPSFLFGVTSTDQVSSAQRLQGSLIAFCSCIAAALAFISLRKLQKTPTSVVICTFSIASIAFGLIYLFIVDNFTIPICGQDAILLVLCGVFGTFGQFLLTTALKLEDAGPISLTRTLDIILAFVFGVSFLDQYPSWTSIVGALVVCSSIVSLAIKKWKDKHRSQNTSLSERKPLKNKTTTIYNSVLPQKAE